MEVNQMGEASSMIGFVVIVNLYIVIGLMSAAGSIFVSQKIFTPKAEQIFFGIFLIPVAGFYLAFTAYFGIETAWLLESAAVLAFVAIGLLGIRVPFALVVGYPLHGLWDLLHELHAHGGFSVSNQVRRLRFRLHTVSFVQPMTSAWRHISIHGAVIGPPLGNPKHNDNCLTQAKITTKHHDRDRRFAGALYSLPFILRGRRRIQRSCDVRKLRFAVD
jgi:hypothetical protein